MTAMSKKQVARFSGKNGGVTPSVAAPGVTHHRENSSSLRHSKVQIYAYNASKYVWRPGSARTRWGA